MKRKIIFILFIFCIIGIPGVSANYSQIIEYNFVGASSWTQGSPTSNANMKYWNSIYFPDITQYRTLTELTFDPDHANKICLYRGTPYLYCTGVTSFPIHVDTSGITGTGTAYIEGTAPNEWVRIIFDTWDIGTTTGAKTVVIDDEMGTNYEFAIYNAGAGYENAYYTNTVDGVTSPVFGGTNPLTGLHQASYSTEYKANLTIKSTTYEGYISSNVTLNRNVGGIDYPSSLEVLKGSYTLLPLEYATTGYSTITAQTHPFDVFVRFGYPTPIYTHYVTYYANGNFTEEVNPTITPTPTPDISSQLCGYWNFSVNTSNVVRNGYVLGTAAESDPYNKHKKIDWFVVLPSGQEIPKKSFVYDEGLFGFGAGWVEININTGAASVSSEAEAKINALQYVIAGNNQKMRIKIYEDLSLVPLVYHDYHLFCTLDQTVHVSETTQGLSVWNINAYDQLTNNLISGITVHLYDYQSGEWQNKTTLIGGSYQFNVVPGNKYRIYIDESYWNTYDEDYTIPSPVPSQPYPVYLIRPLEAIEDASWVMFYVRDGSTLNLMGGVSIALSDGQIQSTSGSGFAKFNVSDSTLYYWSASKTGYTGQSGTFNISSDTLLPDVYLYPAGVVTTPTTIPYWTQTPTPLPTYANGTVIPGYTYAPTVTATLNVIERGAKLTESTDVWYRNAPFLSNLLFLCVIIGIMGLMTKSIGGGRGGRRRN